ncbi:MAG: MFS transporter [Granulosicoccus sp.]|nr:MFS transporter [Granulosicoccus sp.]
MNQSIRAQTAAKASGHFYYGWIMVSVAAVCMFASGPGQSYTFSVFLDPIGADLGISKTTIATAYAVATLVAAFLLPQMGKLLDRLGPRKMLMLVSVLLGLACLLFGAAANFLWLAAGFAMLRFMGQGATMMGTANLVSQWFSRRRGFAMSLMALGFAASMAIHPPLGSFLIESFGWRMAWVILGAMTWVIMLVPLTLLVFDKPEELGLKIDGDRVTEANKGPDVLTGLTLVQAKKERAFYLLCLVWFTVGGLVTVLHFFQVTVLAEQGLDAAVAARMFPISAITMVITMPFVGRLFDAAKTRYVIAIAMCLVAASLFAITSVTGNASAMIYAMTFGLTNAFMMTMFGYLWPRYFGRAHLGSIQGTGQMVGVVGASVAPVPVGLAIDSLGSSSTTLRLLALFSVMVAVSIIIWLKTPADVEAPAGLE